MIEWAITSSVLILVVLILRRVLMGRISLRLQYGLWALVLVRLLLPVSFGATAVSVLNAVEGTQVQLPNPVLGYVGGDIPQLSVTEPAPSLPLEGQEQNLEQPQAEPDAARAETGRPVSLGTVLRGVWAAGAGAVGLWLLWVNVRFAGRLRRSRRPLEADCPRPVYVTGAVQTPCLFGLLRPSIYVTEETAADGTVLRHSLEHELTHYRHKDHLWAALRGVCLALHWYNPLVWAAAVLSRRDGELCCDEATVKRLGEEERAAYGRTLLAVTCQGRPELLLAATSMTGDGKHLKERITLLARRPRTAACALAAAVLISAAAVGCTFTGAEKDIVPDRVTLGRVLSSTQAPEPVTDPETVAQLWALYQAFEFEGTAEGTEGHSAGSLTVSFAWEDSQRTEGFTIRGNGLCALREEGETYRPLRNGAEIYQEFKAVFDHQTEPGGEDGQSGAEVGSADLDRDGEEELISVVQLNPEIWQLVVTKQDGTELLREDAALPHMGWNALYLCRDDQNGDCLLRYNPAIATGMAGFSYTLFTLENGEETAVREGSLDFELSESRERAEELMAFADEVNGLLRHSALLLSTQEGVLTVGPGGWGEHLEHLGALSQYGFLTEEELEGYRAAFQPEIVEGQEMRLNPVSAFFTSYYQRPEELNLEEFLRYFPDDGLVDDEEGDREFQALTAHPLWPFEEDVFVPVPVHRYTREHVDEILGRYAGISAEELSGVGADGVLYLEEYDAWYNFTSDYGPGLFLPVYGLREGSTVTLWELPSGNGGAGDLLTLEERAEGFRILSHLPGA